jgi:methyltransferase-like protein/2-polyprenyl-3-methyl-5-hydroxy-6-metoxy-1,4-benzoquinol methylase
MASTPVPLSDSLQQDVKDSPDETNSYDEVPYPSFPFALTHPDHLYSMGRLFGVDSPAPETCKVLEIGAASGGNIIPMALHLPEASFLGIDLSARQVEEGQQTVETLGIQNIELRQMDALELTSDVGIFDYIICHGVFSWVPEHVQDAILTACHDCLSPTGMAYISYNTYPGWHMRGMIRDMMKYHVRAFEDPTKQIAQAKALLKFLADSTEASETPYSKFLQSELKILDRHSGSYLFHEHLEQVNQPFYFHEFYDRTAKSNLQYVGDAQLSTMWIENLPQKASETLAKLAPQIQQREQYGDFVSNRTFRHSVICHPGSGVNRNIDETRTKNLRYRGQFKVSDEGQSVPLSPTVEVAFTNPRGRAIRTSEPHTKIALTELANSWPASRSVDELYSTVKSRGPKEGLVDAERDEAARTQLANNLNHLIVMGLLDFSYASDRYTTEISEKPAAFSLARLQAKTSKQVATLSHGMITLNDVTRFLVSAIDGTRDREQLVDVLRQAVADGKLVSQGKPDEIDKELQSAVDNALLSLKLNCLLEFDT